MAVNDFVKPYYSESASINRLDTTSWSWSPAGKLTKPRSKSSALWVNGKVFVTGGDSTDEFHRNLPNESCVLTNKVFNCTEDSMSVTEDFPLMFAVDENFTANFCRKLNY